MARFIKPSIPLTQFCKGTGYQKTPRGTKHNTKMRNIAQIVERLSNSRACDGDGELNVLIIKFEYECEYEYSHE